MLDEGLNVLKPHLSLGTQLNQMVKDIITFKVMPKKQPKAAQPAPSRQRQNTSRTNIGRPQDDELETYFMRKLRSGKLQAISAQSEAEIQCHQFEDSSGERGEEGWSEEKVRLVREWFEGIDAARFRPLWEGFVASAEQWEFKQIQSIADFPQFLFCDQCDLCYVLHSLLVSNSPELAGRTEFANDELLFLQLLCFATRDQISFRVLHSLRVNIETVLALMENVKVSVKQCSREQGFDEERLEQPSTNQEIPRDLRSGEVKEVLRRVDSGEGQPQKTRKIEKKPREGKKRGRPRKRQDEMHQDELLKPEELQGVAQRLIAHIVRSYAYIYPQQLRKRREMKMTSRITIDKAIDCRSDSL